MAEDKLTGTVIADKYRVDKIIARGGFSKVYRGTQLGMDRTVALKILDLKADIEATWLERFTREARLVSQLQHPNTITIFDYGQVDREFLYIVMEYIRGSSLSRYIKKRGSLDADRVAHIGMEICRSLEEAHRRNILHRDLKPSNVMLYQDVEGEESIKVLDFGVAKILEPTPDIDISLTQQGTFIGTPRYASPEQLRREDLTPASDLYGVGMIMWEALVGDPAVPDTDYGSCIQYHLGPRDWRLPESIDCPPGLAHIVHRLLEKRAEDRYQTCREVVEDLQNWIEEQARADEAPTTAVSGQGMDDPFSDGAASGRAASSSRNNSRNKWGSGSLSEDDIRADARKLASAAESGENKAPSEFDPADFRNDDFLADISEATDAGPVPLDLMGMDSEAEPGSPSSPVAEAPYSDRKKSTESHGAASEEQIEIDESALRKPGASAERRRPGSERERTTPSLWLYVGLAGGIVALLTVLFFAIWGEDDQGTMDEALSILEEEPARQALVKASDDKTPTFEGKTLVMALKAAGWRIGNEKTREMDGVTQSTMMALKDNFAANVAIYETEDSELARELVDQTRAPAEAVRFGRTVVRVSPGPKKMRNGVYSLTGALFTFKSVAQEQGEEAARQRALEERK